MGSGKGKGKGEGQPEVYSRPRSESGSGSGLLGMGTSRGQTSRRLMRGTPRVAHHELVTNKRLTSRRLSREREERARQDKTRQDKPRQFPPKPDGFSVVPGGVATCSGSSWPGRGIDGNWQLSNFLPSPPPRDLASPRTAGLLAQPAAAALLQRAGLSGYACVGGPWTILAAPGFSHPCICAPNVVQDDDDSRWTGGLTLLLWWAIR